MISSLSESELQHIEYFICIQWLTFLQCNLRLQHFRALGHSLHITIFINILWLYGTEPREWSYLWKSALLQWALLLTICKLKEMIWKTRSANAIVMKIMHRSPRMKKDTIWTEWKKEGIEAAWTLMMSFIQMDGRRLDSTWNATQEESGAGQDSACRWPTSHLHRHKYRLKWNQTISLIRAEDILYRDSPAGAASVVFHSCMLNFRLSRKQDNFCKHAAVR